MISFGPVSASESEKKLAEKERRYKEFIAQKVERMKNHQRSFQVRKESENECLQRKKLYDEKRHILLEQFDLKADANIDDMLPAETFDCMDEQNLGKPVHAVFHSFGDDFGICGLNGAQNYGGALMVLINVKKK